MTARSARQAVDQHPLWYHTMEVAPGVVTPGWFDLRPIVDDLPWPKVEGRRCLDLGPYDGFFSFELERRGAAEVVAVDIGSHADWDWPHDMRDRGPSALAAMTGSAVGTGFRLASELLGSRVERVELSAYDLTPERVGRFDVVVCGALLLHLRDPLRALERIREVCDGEFLSMEEIRPVLSLLRRRTPLAELNGLGELCQWWVPNAAGHRRMVRAGGFEIERVSSPYAVRLGPGHPARDPRLRARVARLAARILTGAPGVPYQAVLAFPSRSGPGADPPPGPDGLRG
jgi:tRNA (mo5U34)-methyltransferase